MEESQNKFSALANALASAKISPNKKRALVQELLKEVGEQLSIIRSLVEMAQKMHEKGRYSERDNLLEHVQTLMSNNHELNRIARDLDHELRQ